MSILIEDETLEAELQSLAARQPIPVSKTTMAKAILYRQVELCELHGPVAWLQPKERTNEREPRPTG